MASVKELVTSVKVLMTLGKTKPGFLREHVNCTKVCSANGSCLDVKDLSEWVLLGMIFIWVGWENSLLKSEKRDMSGYTSYGCYTQAAAACTGDSCRSAALVLAAKFP